MQSTTKDPLQDVSHCSFMATMAYAKNLTIISSIAQLKKADCDSPIIGEGSNTLFSSEIVPSLYKISLLEKKYLGCIDNKHLIRFAAGENWNQCIEWCLNNNFFGLENLALIPGSIGAAPVQNIGAYGREISDFIDQVEYYDRENKTLKILNKQQCCFAYRNSIFKSEQAKYWVITSITIALPVAWQAHTTYQGLSDLDSDTLTPRDIFDKVVQLRQAKLPDPIQIPNLGSFFKNPIISSKALDTIQKTHKEIPYWPANKHIKLSAAWLIDQCHYKGFREGDAGVFEHHALILVNHGHAKGKDILNLAQQIQESVLLKYDVTLEIEPRIL